MNVESLKSWLVVISGLAALVTGILTAFWAYTKFILERGLIPATELQIEVNTIGRQSDKVIIEILIHLKNMGSSTLIARNIRVDIRYIRSNEEVILFNNEKDESGKIFDLRFGKVNFSHALVKDLKENSRIVFEPDSEFLKKNDIRPNDEKRGFKVIQHHTFVQPGVDQIYTFPTALPQTSSFVLLYSSFGYEQRPKKFQLAILRLCRKLGLIQYSLDHIYKAHSIERVFAIKQ